MNDPIAEPLRLAAREVPMPSYLSAQAKALLAPRPPVHGDYPPAQDKAAWRALIAAREDGLLPLLEQINPGEGATAKTRREEDATIYDIMPARVDGGGVILDLHGGGLFLCGGDICRLMSTGIATKLRRHTWSVDYRMPPDHPYPAALDDCLAAYRALLKAVGADQIIVHGSSAGGNLAAALVLRARDEGLPMPAGVVLNTPEIDLTESGDSFHTNLGLDPALRSLMPVNLLYADGHDLAHPYLSPLFGDFAKGFPPTLLTTGTRDLYLSNTVRMHRALRAADVPAELHVVEAGGHGGFPGTPEGEEISRELRRFIAERLGEAGAA